MSMRPLRRWFPGSKASVNAFDARASAAHVNRSLKVDPRTGLQLVKMSWGQLLRRVCPLPVWGKLSGDGPLYNFTESIDHGDGSWGVGPLKGIAFEVNELANLADTRQWLKPDRWGAYRFADLRYGSSGGSCAETTITVLDGASGMGKSGVVVTINQTAGVGSPTTTATGMTTAGGTFGPVALANPNAYTVTIDFAGITADFVIAPCGSATFCVCSAEVDVTTQSGATLTTNPAELHGVGDFSATSLVVSGHTVTLSEIRRCGSEHPTYGSAFPVDLTITASMAGCKDFCQTGVVGCGSTQTVDLTLFSFEACYADTQLARFLGPALACPDLGCSTGPGPVHRGLLPRTVQVRPISTSNLFADDENQWITLTLNTSNPDDWYYDSGCRGFQGNYLGLPSGRLNGLDTYDTGLVDYGSTRILLFVNVPGGFQYTRWPLAGCTQTGSNNCDDGSLKLNCGRTLNLDGTICSPCATTINGDTTVCTPTDYTISGSGFTVEVMEVACS